MAQQRDADRSPLEAHVVVRGRVQGVNFRWYTQQQAQAHGISGWVRNCPDGSVEAVLQGAPEAVRSIVEWMRLGPPSARVTETDVEWRAPATVADAFEIIR
ncbi:MAG TPA: acylphosphatase [Chloroflexota bacterium]|nr:acylphosphatase [Chloroflexota bacterium]